MQLVLDTPGIVVKKRNASFWIKGTTAQRQISPARITSIAVLADCLISASAIRLAAANGIPIFFYSATARLEAKLWGPDFGSVATIRRNQTLFERQTQATEWVVGLMVQKLEQQRGFLMQLTFDRPSFSAEIRPAIALMEQHIHALAPLRSELLATCRNQLLGVEGQIARTYWGVLAKCLPAGLNFAGRNRRPATDPLNAALNYLYGMLYAQVGMATVAAGLDPYLGFLHTDGYARPAFTFDLIEPFRPWVDELLVRLAFDGTLQENLFAVKENGLFLNKAGKQVLIPAFNDLMEEKVLFKGQRLSRKNHVYHYAGELAQMLLHLKL